MPTAESIMANPDTRFFGLFTGRSGGGKSTAAYSFPKPMKILDLDGRVRGGLSNPWISDLKSIDVEYYPPMNKKELFYVKLNKDLEVLLTLAQMGQLNVKTLVLDSITHEAINLLLDAIPLTHAEGKGKTLGTLHMAGPEDYGFQATATYQVLAFLKSLNIPNIIVTAHIVNKWGKPSGAEKFAPSVIIGEQLSLTDKMAENVLSYFDHIYRFNKEEVGPSNIHYYAKFNGEMERSGFMGMPEGEVDITGKNFFEGLMRLREKGVETSGKV